MRSRTVLVAAVFVVLAALATAEMASAGILSNVAAFKPATASELYDPAYPATNGNDDWAATFSHGVSNYDCWWRVDLQQAYDIGFLEIRCRDGLADRTNWAILRAYAADGTTQIGPDLMLTGFDNVTPVVLTFDNGGAGWSGAQFFQIGGEGIGVPYLHVSEFRAFAQVEVYQGFITGVTATSDNVWSGSTHPDVNALYVANSLGMSDQSGPLGDPNAVHREMHGAMWHTEAYPTEPTITFDLGGSYDLGRMLIWNHNQPGLQTRGLREVLIETSTDGIVFTALADANGGEQGNLTIPISPGGDAPYQASVSLTGVTATQVRITAFSNYGDAYWGLSEVRFYDSTFVSDHPGDANRDGKVDDLDASILAANWQRTGDATWTQADFNGDTNVNDLDASILAANWQYGVGAAVPEPGAFGLIIVGAAAMLGLRRRGR